MPPLVARSLALTMPWVTVWPMPKGLPTASTTSPTASASLSAKVTAGSFSSALIFSTATSVRGSLPTVFAVNSRPSASVTRISLASLTTWLFVKM